MLALVTGSTGFVGSHVCRALISSGFRVRAFHRSSSPSTALQDLDVENALGDITQPDTLSRSMQGVEVVFHTAAVLGKQASHPGELYNGTVLGTRNVLEAANKAGVRRVVHTSSVAALGVPGYGTRIRNPIPISEDHTWNYSGKWWPYGYAKFQAELEVQAAVAKGQDVVIVNPSVIIGPGDLNRISGDVIVHAARRRIPVAPPGGLNIVHVSDVARGHLAALERGRMGQRYILGGENLTHLQFLGLLADITGVIPPRWVVPAVLLRASAIPIESLTHLLHLPVNGRALHRAGYFFHYQIQKARSELGLPAPIPARQAIQEAYEWYNQHQFI
jgi:dihydroflavonol-4-reductase